MAPITIYVQMTPSQHWDHNFLLILVCIYVGSCLTSHFEVSQVHQTNVAIQVCYFKNVFYHSKWLSLKPETKQCYRTSLSFPSPIKQLPNLVNSATETSPKSMHYSIIFPAITCWEHRSLLPGLTELTFFLYYLFHITTKIMFLKYKSVKMLQWIKHKVLNQ